MTEDILKKQALEKEEHFRPYVIGQLELVLKRLDEGNCKFEAQQKELTILHDLEERRKGAWGVLLVLAGFVAFVVSVATQWLIKQK